MESLPDTAIHEIMSIMRQNVRLGADFESAALVSDWSMASIDNRISEHGKQLSVINRHVKQEVVALARQRNTLLPIHRLPVELISNVFAITIVPKSLSDYSYEDFESSLSRLRRLTSVSSKWRQIASDTASLWTTLDVCDAMPMLEKALRLSQQALINLNTPSHLSFLSARLAAKFGGLFELLQPHRHRFRSINCSAFIVHPHLRMLSRLPAEALESFTITINPHRAFGPRYRPVDLFQGEAKNLKDLSICFPTHWNSAVLSSLRSLSLTRIAYHGPSVEQIRNVLVRSPGLQELTLQSVNILGVTEPTSGAVEISHLQSLDLVLPPRTMQAILFLIQPPKNIENMWLRTKVEDPDSMNTTLQAMTPFFDAFCQRYSNRKGQITLEVNRQTFTINIRTLPNISDDEKLAHGKSQSCNLQITCQSPIPALLWALSSGSVTLPSGWEVDVSVTGKVGRPILEALGQNPRVTVIRIKIYRSRWVSMDDKKPLVLPRVAPMDDFLEYLSTPPSTPGDPWPFPMLLGIVFEFGGQCDAADVLHMVERRYQVAEGMVAPRKLDFLHFKDLEGMDRPTFDKVVEMLEETEVLFGTNHPEVVDSSSKGSESSIDGSYNDNGAPSAEVIESSDAGSNSEADGDQENNNNGNNGLLFDGVAESSDSESIGDIEGDLGMDED